MRFKLSLILNAIYPTIIYACGIVTIIFRIFQPEIPEPNFNNPDAASINWQNFFVVVMIIAILIMFINIGVSLQSLSAYDDVWSPSDKVVKGFMLFTLIVVLIATCTDGLFMLLMLFFELPCLLMVKYVNTLIKTLEFPVDSDKLANKSRDEMINIITDEYPEAKEYFS